MEKYEINKYLEKFEKSANDILIPLDSEVVFDKINYLSSEMSKEDFWNDQKKSAEIIA